VRLLAQVVEAGVGQLRALCGNLHGEAAGDSVGALTVHQSEALEVPWSKDGGNLRENTEGDTGVCDSFTAAFIILIGRLVHKVI